MSRKGAGTRNSPISIDDSEEEVLNIIEPCDDSQGSTPPVRTPNEHVALDTSLSHYQVSKLFDRLQEDSPPPMVKKRKRSESIMTTSAYNMSPIAGSSRMPQQLPLETRLSNLKPESKKARKRRRKLERQEAEYRMRMQRRDEWQPVSDSQSYVAFAAGMQKWPTLAQTYANPAYFNDPAQVASNMTSFGVDYMNDPYTPYVDDVQKPISPPQQLSGSSWVSSMVMAASALESNQLEPDIQEYTPPEHLSAPEPASHVPPPPPVLEHAKVSTLPPVPKALEVHGLPAKPPPQQHIIGMKPDPDPKSKHGVFTFPKKDNAANYIPNPARTLVMEQLPKSHRNADFVNSWSRNACDSQPVHVSIDSAQGKALVEFATAELARKAWGSPKLGSQYAGLKPHQLRGKPREDLIKVWWYRVDGVGAGAGVGEIEEGEIEGEEVDKEASQVEPKKETKKERKARLAREREEKRLKAEAAQKELALKTAVKQGTTAQTQASQVSQPEPVLPTIQAAPSVPVQLPQPPVPSTPLKNDIVNSYSSSYHPFPLPTWAPQHTAPSSLPPAPAYLPLNPQALKRVAMRNISGTSFGASLPRGLDGAYDDHESIASSRGEGSKSPEVLPSPLITRENLEDYQDMDLDGDDMEIDSPNSPFTPAMSVPLPTEPIVEIATPSPKIQPAALAIPTGPRIRNIQPASIQSRVPTSESMVASSSSLSITPKPMHPPLEPRAVRGVPTAPGHTKRTLLARQRELEERIAMSKRELELATKKPGSPGVVTSTEVLPSSAIAATASLSPSVEIDKQAMEDRLRQLVLKSQKSKKQAVVPDPPPPEIPFIAKASPSPASAAASSQVPVPSAIDTATKSPSVTLDPQTVSVSTHAFTLEDLAVSFITQTIQTVKSQPPPSSSTPPHESVETTPRINLKLELAAKQKRLEMHIAESKVLMAKLTQARTKQEKDAIIAAMREHSRLMEEEDRRAVNLAGKSSSVSNVAVRDPSGRHLVKDTAPFNIRWPESQVDAGVFIVSDDEDSDTADGE